MEQRPTRKKTFLSPFAELINSYFPELKKKLSLADISTAPLEFLEKVLFSAICLSAGFSLVVAIIFHALHINIYFTLLAFPFILVGMFFYLMAYPDMKIIKRQKEIECELVFAGRHILIALRAGMPFFDSLVGVSSGYGAISQEFKKIVEKINMGVPMAHAVRESGAQSTSSAFARIMMQLSNALTSGADVASSLEVVLDQIANEQVIALKAYGQKLNPLVMFFMMFGIIFPSLGVAFAIILFSFISSGAIGMTSMLLVYVVACILIIQFIFLSIIETSKPNYIL